MNLKQFQIDITSPGITVNVKTRDPCDCVALSGAIVHHLRTVMDKDPKVKIIP